MWLVARISNIGSYVGKNLQEDIGYSKKKIGIPIYFPEDE
jgi:hypothetical protein